MAKVRDWNWETIFTDNIQPLRPYLSSKEMEIGEQHKIRAITRTVHGHRGRYQSKARMRLPISDL